MSFAAFLYTNFNIIDVIKHGRVVFDGGGVEADVKVKLPKPSALEIALQVTLSTGVL